MLARRLFTLAICALLVVAATSVVGHSIAHSDTELCATCVVANARSTASIPELPTLLPASIVGSSLLAPAPEERGWRVPLDCAPKQGPPALLS